MKKYTFYGIILCLIGGIIPEIFAQKSIGIPPYSLSKDAKEVLPSIPLIELAAPDMQAVLEEDLRLDWDRTGVSIPVTIDIHQHGKWTNLPNGGKLWQLQIQVDNAKGLMLEYAAFKLPKEATLHIYNPDQTQVLGAYSSINNTNGGTFATDMIRGEELILEYFQPADCQGKPDLKIEEVSYIYQETASSRDVCDIGINCPEGADWQIEKKGVVRIRMKFSDNVQFTTTGVILNNTNADGIPYVLTSLNRVLTAEVIHEVTPQFDNFIFYFNEELEECQGSEEVSNNVSMVGCVAIAGHFESDFLLLRIIEEIPTAPHDPRYLGWNRTETYPYEVTSIYHSSNGYKGIAFENDAVQVQSEILPTSIYDYPANSFYQIGWDNGHTESGSEGAPILDNSGHVRGWMIDATECGSPASFAGKLSSAWAPENVPLDEQLKPWLDPAETDDIVLNGLHISGSCTTEEEEGSCSQSNLISQGNKATLGKLAKFISQEMRGNYKLLEAAYINNMEAVEEALTSNHPKYHKLQQAIKGWSKEIQRNFFRAFIFEMDNKVSDKGLKTTQKILEEFAKVIPNSSFQETIHKINRLMWAAKGKDLKAGLIAFDQANLADFPVEVTSTPEAEQLVALVVQGNPSATPMARFAIPETGRVRLEVFDLNGRLLATPLDAVQDTGNHDLPLSQDKLQAGVYLIKLTFYGSEGIVMKTKKVVLNN